MQPTLTITPGKGRNPMTKLRAAMLQTRVFADKMENIREAGRKLEAWRQNRWTW